MNYRNQIKGCNRIVVKVGSSTLTHNNGNINLTRIEKLTRVLSDLMNSGKEVVLVSSGAVAVGVNKLKLKEKPKSIKETSFAFFPLIFNSFIILISLITIIFL